MWTALGPAVSLLLAATAPEPLALTGANVVDVRTGRVIPNATVVLRDGKILSVGSVAAPAGVKTLDVKGRYVLPGLIDCHTHMSTLAAARLALQSGVTTVRSSGASNYADVGFRELVRAGVLPGPDVVAAGYHVRRNLAEEAFLSDPSPSGLITRVEGPEAVRQVVRTLLSHGVDVVKVMATERAGLPDTDPRKPVLSETELKAAVEEAAAKGVPVQAHAHGDEGARAAVRAGVRSIEHGTYLSDETLTLMKEKGTFLVPTYATVIDLREAGGDYDIAGLADSTCSRACGGRFSTRTGWECRSRPARTRPTGRTRSPGCPTRWPRSRSSDSARWRRSRRRPRSPRACSGWRRRRGPWRPGSKPT
jgi:imidazolonepropionase-like amidohydrolase